MMGSIKKQRLSEIKTIAEQYCRGEIDELPDTIFAKNEKDIITLCIECFQSGVRYMLNK